MTNGALAAALADLADLLALDGGDAHRIAHYRGTATAIRRFEHPLADMIEAGIDLTQVPGIGEGLARFIGELVADGRSPRLEDLRVRIPPGLLEIMRLDGVGTTRARTLWKQGGVESVSELEAALGGRGLHGLDGFGPGVASRIRRGLSARGETDGRAPPSAADRAAAELGEALEGRGLSWLPAGDIVRRLETVGDIEMVVATTPVELWDALSTTDGWTLTNARGANPVTLSLGKGAHARLVAADPDQVEAVAHYLTGPAEYIEALADLATAHGMTLTPLGLARGPDVEIQGEQEMYDALDLPRIPPELRVDATTIERVQNQGLPDLIDRATVTGDLHMHTTWSDGAASLERMVRAASDRGYQYIAITDHSPSTGPVGGLDAAALTSQREEIESVQEDFPDVKILAGVEVDILPDGTLDLDDDALSRLDIVVASVHSAFELGEARMTQRIIRALSNPLVHILAHPMGRKLGRRLGYPVDMSAIIDAAEELDVALEVNGNPRRLDLSAEWLWQCMERGVNVVVSSDAHSVERLDNVDYAVDQARRGWVETPQVLNTKEVSDVLEWTRRRRG